MKRILCRVFGHTWARSSDPYTQLISGLSEVLLNRPVWWFICRRCNAVGEVRPPETSVTPCR